MSMYTYFQREAKDLHLPPGSCLKERETEKANKLVKIAMDNGTRRKSPQVGSIVIIQIPTELELVNMQQKMVLQELAAISIVHGNEEFLSLL